MSIQLSPESEINELLTLPEEELYRRLGNDVSGKGALPRSPQDLIEAAQRWLRANSRDITAIVCGNDKVKSIASPTLIQHERVMLVALIADVLGGHEFGVHTFTLAAILVRQGVHELCHSAWAASS